MDPANAPATARLPADVQAFIQGGVSITLASRDERLIPSIAKGVGCRVDAEGRHLGVMVFADAAEGLVRDVASGRPLAVVFSQPSTNRTVQIKSRGASALPAQPADVATARRFLALFAAEIGPLGWDERYVNAVFWDDPSQLLVLRFEAEDVFAQTPGPAAGQRLDLVGAGRR